MKYYCQVLSKIQRFVKLIKIFIWQKKSIIIKINHKPKVQTLVHFNPNLVSMSEIEIENHAAVKWIKSIKAGAAITLMRHN